MPLRALPAITGRLATAAAPGLLPAAGFTRQEPALFYNNGKGRKSLRIIYPGKVCFAIISSRRQDREFLETRPPPGPDNTIAGLHNPPAIHPSGTTGMRGGHA